MNKMYEYLKEHNYISKNENKDPLRQQELSTTRAECIANKYDSLTNELQQKYKQQQELINKAIDLLNTYIGVLDDTSDLFFKNVKSILEAEEEK